MGSFVAVAAVDVPVRPDAIRQPQSRRGASRKIGIGLVVLVVVGVGLGVVLGSKGPPGPPPASVGIVENRPVPASVAGIPLIDAQGRRVSLDYFAGKIVVLTPFMTSCQETCPLTTGAFVDMERDIDAAGLGAKIVFVEASVDPRRDTTARLTAYAHVTGVRWPLLTGTATNLAALWKYFGVYYQVVPEDNPPGTDWQTGQPYTYDVNHSDGFVLIDAQQHQRFVTGAAPDIQGHRLEANLEGMLDAQGFKDLSAPAKDAWTIPEALQALGWLAGKQISPVD